MYNPLYSTLQPLCSTCSWYTKKRDVLRWVHTCNVTAYRNTLLWQRGQDSCPRNVSKVGYAVTLRACSVCCRYLAFASKEWYGYGRSRCGRATSCCTSTPAAMTWDRRLYFPSEGRRAEHFFALKIQWLRPGANPQTWVPKASMLPLDHRSRLDLFSPCSKLQQKKNSVHIKLTLRRVPVTIVTMGKQYVLHILSVGL